MEKNYELVCVIDSRLSMEDISSQVASVEKLLWSIVLEKDEMWLLPLAYPLKGQMQAYFVSYYLLCDTQRVAELKSELLLEKFVLKFHLFSMKQGEKFMHFDVLKKAYEELLPQEEESGSQDDAPDGDEEDVVVKTSTDSLS